MTAGDAECTCGWAGPRGEAFEHAATHAAYNRERPEDERHSVSFHDDCIRALHDGETLHIDAQADAASAGGDAG